MGEFTNASEGLTFPYWSRVLISFFPFYTNIVIVLFLCWAESTPLEQSACNGQALLFEEI